MNFSVLKPYESIIRIFFRSYTSKYKQYRTISPQLRFYLDTKSIYGPQKVIQEKRCTKPSELDLFIENPRKKVFEEETELLYAGSNGLRRACSLPKGVSIAGRQKYIRDLFRIPRGHRISLFPQAYIANKNLGLRRRKDK